MTGTALFRPRTAFSQGQLVLSDEELMLALRTGSRGAFDTLFERYRDTIWRFFRRRTEDSARAEELVQDVFVAILQNAVRYEPRSSFRSYLFGIAYNAVMAERRAHTRTLAGPLLADPPASTPDPDDTLWVRRALGSLAPDHREVLMLREYEQLSYQEISELLRIPLNTVRSRLFRARMDLKAALERLPATELKVADGSR